MLCAHMLPSFMKLAILLVDYFVDVMCFELVSLSRRSDWIISFSNDGKNSINESLVNLASAKLILKNLDAPDDLNNNNSVNSCNDYSNARAETL